jgi:hypothetical protein
MWDLVGAIEESKGKILAFPNWKIGGPLLKECSTREEAIDWIKELTRKAPRYTVDHN